MYIMQYIMSNYTTVTLRKETYNKLSDFTREVRATNSEAVDRLLTFYWKDRKEKSDKALEKFREGIRGLGIKKKLKSSELNVINAYL